MTHDELLKRLDELAYEYNSSTWNLTNVDEAFKAGYRACEAQLRSALEREQRLVEALEFYKDIPVNQVVTYLHSTFGGGPYTTEIVTRFLATEALEANRKARE